MKQTKRSSAQQGMTPLQKQAALVCALCVLAMLLTVCITFSLLKKGKPPVAPSEPASSSENEVQEPELSDHYQIDNASTALLTPTADAGSDYQDTTLFLGDSNTVRLYNNGLISLQQFCAKEGIGTQTALTEGIVTFRKDDTHYTIAQAVAKMKPRRVVMTFGTNDTGMEVAEFIASYTALVEAVQESYPYTDIIVNTVPPIPENHSSYPGIDQTRIDDFNMALLDMCEELGVKFLNTAEVLKGEDGYGIAEYYTNGDIHLKSAGLKAILSYLRTHAYETEDRRPDTNNIPTRTLEYVSNPSSAVAAPSSSESASSSQQPDSESTSSSSSSSSAASSEAASSSDSTSSEETVSYEVVYRAEKGGSLTSGEYKDKTTLRYQVTSAAQKITVTAKPAEGYVFLQWSDGVTKKTREDTDFEQDLELTAIFSKVNVKITGEGKGTLGTAYTFRAQIDGEGVTAQSLHWFANGEEIREAIGLTDITVMIDPSMLNSSYKIQAAIYYNGTMIRSNTLTVSIGGGVDAGSQPGASSGSSTSQGGSASSSASASSSMASSSSVSSSSAAVSSSQAQSSSAASGSVSSSSETSSKSETVSSAASKSESTASSKSELASSTGAASSKSEASSAEASASREASKENA